MSRPMLLDVLLGRAEPAGGEGAALAACLDSPLWVSAVLAGVPYDSAETLLAAADAAARALPREAVLLALRAHPRIGERVQGDSETARMSRAEQSRVSTDDVTRARLAEANRAYEARFGHVFLIRAAGLSEHDVLDALEERLEHDPSVELAVAGDQLRQIALLRLQAQLVLDAQPAPDQPAPDQPAPDQPAPERAEEAG